MHIHADAFGVLLQGLTVVTLACAIIVLLVLGRAVPDAALPAHPCDGVGNRIR
ncbi:hypothetical protein ACCD08_18370 [Telluria sp. Tellsp104]